MILPFVVIQNNKGRQSKGVRKTEFYLSQIPDFTLIKSKSHMTKRWRLAKLTLDFRQTEILRTVLLYHQVDGDALRVQAEYMIQTSMCIFFMNVGMSFNGKM